MCQVIFVVSKWHLECLPSLLILNTFEEMHAQDCPILKFASHADREEINSRGFYSYCEITHIFSRVFESCFCPRSFPLT